MVVGPVTVEKLAAAVVDNGGCSRWCSVEGVCLESVEWNGGMDYWNGILEWTRTRSLHLHVI